MNRILILTGGSVEKSQLQEFIRMHDISAYVVVDGGLEVAHDMGIRPDYVIGDFDTVSADTLQAYMEDEKVKVVSLVPEKDYTDTYTAMEKAIELQPDEIVIFGGTGTRLDHTISNIHLLQKPLYQGIPAYMLDGHNKIYLIQGEHVLHRDTLHGPYVSLLPLGDAVTGITLEGFRYPLTNAVLHRKDTISLGVSNELVAEQGKITLATGVLLVVEARDVLS